MTGHGPVVLPPEGVETGPLGHVPDADALVLAVAEDELLAGVEDGAADVVVVAAAGVHLPGLGRSSSVGSSVDGGLGSPRVVREGECSLGSPRL